VIRVRNVLKALEILELFLEMIKTRLDFLATQKAIPAEMRTSVLSIAYAASRLDAIPELGSIRRIFESKFGREVFLEVTRGEPDSGTGVQEHLLRCLSVEPPTVLEKVAAAEDIMQRLGRVEWSTADLEKVCQRCL
jgi:hypothetical protein